MEELKPFVEQQIMARSESAPFTPKQDSSADEIRKFKGFLMTELSRKKNLMLRKSSYLESKTAMHVVSTSEDIKSCTYSGRKL